MSEVSNPEILHHNEISHLLGKTWTDVYEHRETSVFASDLNLLKLRGVSYYLPAYLLCSLGQVENDLITDLMEILPRYEVYLLKEYNFQQRSFLCKIFARWRLLPEASDYVSFLDLFQRCCQRTQTTL